MQHVCAISPQVTKVRVAEEGLFKLSEPDPDWRNEADCGEATFKRPDGSLVPLNCAGPRHTYFRCGWGEGAWGTAREVYSSRLQQCLGAAPAGLLRLCYSSPHRPQRNSVQDCMSSTHHVSLPMTPPAFVMCFTGMRMALCWAAPPAAPC
jgi:hypothetical protein